MRSSSLVADRRTLALCLLTALGTAVGFSVGCLEPISVGGSTAQVTQEAEWVGNPCTPNDEKNPSFPGFSITETTIDRAAPECGGGAGVCLVNHFQGRVSCPLGQSAPVDANDMEGCIPELDAEGAALEAQGSCEAGSLCVYAGSVSPACDPSDQQAADLHCEGFAAGSQCNPAGFCECNVSADCLAFTNGPVYCQPSTRQCLMFGCHEPGDCQSPDAPPAENDGQACCLPASDKPVLAETCGACKGAGGQATRTAEQAVYCSCRCGVAEGAPEEPDFDFCTCPDGFECSEIQPYSGLGNAEVAGKYCIKAGTAYDPTQDQCGLVDGHWTSGGGGLACAGAPSGG